MERKFSETDSPCSRLQSSVPEIPQLSRAIKLPQATAIVVGIIIGASIFVQPSEITGRVPSATGIFLVWAIAGLLTFLGASVCAEFASIFQQSGGVYVYLKETYSPSLGFLWGWAMFWSMHSGIIAAIAVIFGRYAAYFIPLGPARIKGVAIAAVLGLSGINYLGVKQGSWLQTLFTFGKVIAIVGIISVGFLLGPRVPGHSFGSGGVQAPIDIGDFLVALAAGLFAFGGWHMVTYNAEETVNPRKTIPQALLIGIAIVTVCYIALNAVYLFVLPLKTVMSSDRVAADAADALFGGGGGAMMSALVIFSTIGALNGVILCGPRVYYAMARDGLLFRWLGGIHNRHKTPHKAILVQAVWSSVLVVSGTYRALFTRVVYTEWIFFGLLALGLIILRKKPGFAGSHKIRGYPFVPVLFAVVSFAIVINQIAAYPKESLFGLFVFGVGLPVYYFWVNKKTRRNTT
jgi:APA family basic amino acid/polyamine antiporter